MDKQKQIGEMAKDKEFKKLVRCIENTHPFYVETIAEKLCNAGYRKIPEGAVVVSKQVWDEHIENWDKTTKAVEERVRKETTEKFAEMERAKITAFLEEKLKDNDYIKGKKQLIKFSVAVAGYVADEICKELIGEK